MADYSKLSVRAVYSENSDYTNPITDTRSLELTGTPTRHQFRKVLVATTADVTTIIDVSVEDWTSVDFLVIENKSTTAAEIVTCVSEDASGNALSVEIPAPGMLVLSSFDIDKTTGGDITLSSASGTPECDVFISGT